MAVYEFLLTHITIPCPGTDVSRPSVRVKKESSIGFSVCEPLPTRSAIFLFGVSEDNEFAVAC